MKTKLFIGLGAMALIASCSSKPSTEYTINGTTDAADGETVYLTYRLSSDSTVNDSAVVANGTFSFTGNIEIPKSAYISLGKRQNANGKIRQMMIEPGVITVALTGDNYQTAEVNGSPLTQQMDSITAIEAAAYETIRPYYAIYDSIQKDSVALAEFNAKYDAAMNEVKDAKINFMKTHPNSYYSPVIMGMAKMDLSLDELKEIYNSWAPEIQAADQATSNYISALESIQPGSPAPEITGKDQNGNDVTLSGMKGKVVLLDFWATWCGPCRASLPHVKEVYEKYNNKGLEVLCVSLDRDENAWKDYISNSGMGMEKYAHVYDEPVNNADNYAVMYIPSKFIVDAEGNMVGRFDDEKELDAKLAELLEK